jgi:hypothetical protein
MFWFDRANPQGGLCYADKNLGTEDVSGLGGPIAPDGNGFYRFCGRNNPADASKKPFAPRIGFAYRLSDRTVVRGGYGIFFDSAETREIDNSGDIYPFVVRASTNPNVDNSLPKLTDNMFPAVPLHQVTPAADGSQFFAVIISEFPHNPYVQQWSLSIQRELARNTTLKSIMLETRELTCSTEPTLARALRPRIQRCATRAQAATRRMLPPYVRQQRGGHSRTSLRLWVFWIANGTDIPATTPET